MDLKLPMIILLINLLHQNHLHLDTICYMLVNESDYNF